MSYESIVPEWKPKRLNKENSECIQCGDVYSEKLGGIVWDGRKTQYFICGACSHYVVPALASDYEMLLYDQHLLSKEATPREIEKVNREFSTGRRLSYFVSLVNALHVLGILKDKK